MLDYSTFLLYGGTENEDGSVQSDFKVLEMVKVPNILKVTVVIK